jgi:NADPH:quinone reductase-like Zn-dependent oxidoreductase
MRKIVIHRPGGYGRLRLETHPDPAPGTGEVLLAVRHAGVNYADCVTRMGLYASAKQLVGWPITPGFEVAGEVAVTGAGVSGLVPGTRVMGITLFNGYSSRLVLPEAQVFPVPGGLDTAQAAAIPTIFLTAWFALRELAHARPGERVLVHSAAGGVGSAALQLARQRGCEVTAVVGAAHKTRMAHAMGAQQVIDKSREDLWAAVERIAPQGFDVVLDANGAATLGASYRHLAPLGRLVVYGFHGMLPKQGGRPSWPKLAWDWLRTPRFNPLRLTVENRSVLAFNLSFLSQRTDLLLPAMREILAGFERGELHAPPITTYPLEQVADAHRALESGQTVGKLVLEM